MPFRSPHYRSPASPESELTPTIKTRFKLKLKSAANQSISRTRHSLMSLCLPLALLPAQMSAHWPAIAPAPVPMTVSAPLSPPVTAKWGHRSLAAGEALLFNVRSGGLEPVAIREAGGGFRELPLENSWQAKALSKEYFFPGMRYDVYRNGQSRAVLDIESFQAAGCSGFGFATGQLRPPLADPQSQERFIAFSQGFPGPRNYAGELPLDDQQRALAESMTRANYAGRGLSAELLKRLQIDAVQALSLNQGQTKGLMVASRIQPEPDSSSGCNTHALLLLLEQSPQGWVPRLELYKTDTQAEGMCSGYSYISGFRTEPASDYLLIEGWGYEWNWYEIYRRTPNGTYQQEFSGGGGGC